MKQIIRLKESQLRDMIYETVSGLISELDWKTYANAEKKASERGDISYWREKGETDPKKMFNNAVDNRFRAERFGNAAKDAFNRDFGYQQGEHFYDDDYQRVGMGGDFNSTEEFSPHAAGWRHDGVASMKEFPHGVYTYERTPEEFFGNNPDAIQAYRNADDEVKKYKKGKYSYEKGKGWSTNESKLRNIIAECVRRALCK